MHSFHDLLMPPKGRSVSVSAENVYGKKGAGGMALPGKDAPVQPDVLAIGQNPTQGDDACRELGQKFKVRPNVALDPHVETVLLDAEGPGVIRHIWMTLFESELRNAVLRFYWDDETEPSVMVPVGDFFCNASKYTASLQSIPVCVNPTNGMNCYWPMPFRRHARVTVENLKDEPLNPCFYTINYTEEPVDPEAAYFHASFRRFNPTRYGEDVVIADGIHGCGSFAGCYLAWQQNNAGWWGEGEVKMFIDGDREFPSICGTGAEDYFGGAWAFNATFSAPYSGFPLGKEYDTAGRRHSMYRFHVPDPVWFRQDFRMTIQALGWRSEHRFLPLQDDVSATAYWYQNEPHAPLPELPDRNGLEVI